MIPFSCLLAILVGLSTFISTVCAQLTYAATAEACADPHPYPGRFCLISSEVCCLAPDTCIDGTTTYIQAGGSEFPPGGSGQSGPIDLPLPPSPRITLPIRPSSSVLPLPEPSPSVPIPGGDLSVVSTPTTSLSVSVPSRTISLWVSLASSTECVDHCH